MTSMSSVRPFTRDMRANVRPHGHGSRVTDAGARGQGALRGRAPGGGGEEGAARAFRPVVKAKPAGEEAVPVRDVDERPRAAACGSDRTRAAVRPQVEVIARVRDDRRLPAR